MIKPIQGTQREVKDKIYGFLEEANLEDVINITFQQEGPNLFRADVIMRTRNTYAK